MDSGTNAQASTKATTSAYEECIKGQRDNPIADDAFEYACLEENVSWEDVEASRDEKGGKKKRGQPHGYQAQYQAYYQAYYF
jgi:hypothetical protein